MAYDELSAYAERALNPERRAAVLRHAGRVAFDVGCGNGSYVLSLNGERAIFGADRQRFDSWSAAPARFVVSDATKLPLAAHSVDTVLCFETLEHLPDPAAALSEYRRIARDRIVVTVPNCELTPGMRQSNLVYYHWVDRTHRNFFDLSTISQLVASAGFKVIEAYYINRVNIFPFIGEALRLPATAVRVLGRILRRVTRSYPMTCLVVGQVVR